ncbi:hypothetical protein R1sor_000868 [Riccia sorocarpa]|uniref:RING-type domain-containing protein n=1 Tax=Riccia sorocarpa TaxID=122646 RepID=A0ABD3GWB7_9MARC
MFPSGNADLPGSALEWLLELSNFCHEEDDSVECGCCFEACDFRSMVQVRKCFSDEEWLKYEQRRAEDAVAKANLGGLVYCFHCKHPWQVDPEMNIFTCLKESCLKRTCLKCKEADHSPEPCRKSMTQAVIRICTFCSAQLVKNEGCNKIVCRCGQKMCYVCRKPIEDYSHFCPHIRSRQELGKACMECTQCCLWTEDDESTIVQAAKSAALKKVASQHPDFLKRKIGPSEEAKDRRPKTEDRKRWR